MSARKINHQVQLLAVFWTLLLAVPFTALALSFTAYTIDHAGDIVAAIQDIGRSISVGGRGIGVELSARWPEIAGMVVGQLVIMLILLMARNNHALNKQ